MAEKKLLLAIKKMPNLEGALNALGLVYMYKRDFPKSISYFKKLLEIIPTFIDAYNSLGLIYTELNQYDSAKENLLIAANAKGYHTPENAFVNLAMLELKYNRLDAATRYAEKALEKNKGFAPIYNIKGIIAERENKHEEAISYFKKALSLLTEEDASILINMGQVYIKAGEKRKALDILEQALAKAKNRNMKEYIQNIIKNLEN
jgi:tetratricopeptide (TPR) repeat protein